MFQIRYPQFDFAHPLTQAIFDVERELTAFGRSQNPFIFLQLSELFRFMTSLMSARIEGNRTTLTDALSSLTVAPSIGAPENLREILNVHDATEFIDKQLLPEPYSHAYFRELHKRVVAGLKREGDHTPGSYRLGEVRIEGSNHKPPWPADVREHMDQLIQFLNTPAPTSRSLLKMAIAHHAFLWIHPFGNGNGRMARLLSYSLLAREAPGGFPAFLVINPTSLFAADRQAYYDNLVAADAGTDEGLLTWCTYFVAGILDDLARMRRLADYEFVRDEVLIPAVTHAQSTGRISVKTSDALAIAAREEVIRASDLETVFTGSPARRSQQIRELVDDELLARTAAGARTYRLALKSPLLVPSLIAQLRRVGLLPTALEND